MTNKITYILGAGASYQSIPVVNTFNRRVLTFKNFLEQQREHIVNLKQHSQYGEVIKSYKKLVEDFSSHQSFDTYFKKLYHLGDFGKIQKSKKLLNLYFLWEHSANSFFLNTMDTKSDFIKQSLYDKRYDALVAGLLHPKAGCAETICDVTFITWNYDVNLLNSIKTFFYPNKKFRDMIQEIERNQFLWVINENVKIININGYFFSDSLGSLSDLKDLDGKKIITRKIIDDNWLNSTIDEFEGKIKFAWELNDANEKSMKELLRNEINSSQSVIVIGYTFPVYNRFIDLGYLNQEALIKKRVYIQDPNAEAVRQNIIDVYRLGDNSKIQALSNCDSFYLPSSVFGIDEYNAFKEPIAF